MCCQADVLELLSMKEKNRRQPLICVLPFLLFLLSGRAVVTWANALKLHFLINNRLSFFCDTCKSPGYMDFIKICTVMCLEKFILRLISLHVKFYIHKYFIQRGESFHS